MDATEVFETIGPYMQKLCKNDTEHCIAIADEKQLNQIQRQAFYQLCGHHNYTTNDKSCETIEKSVDEYEQKTNKSITLEINGCETNIVIHPKLRKLRCFSICKSKQMQNQKTVALIINQWPTALLGCIKEERLHIIVRETSKIEDDISADSNKYMSDNVKFLMYLDIIADINKKKGDGLTHFIDKLCFKFLKQNKHHENYLNIMNDHIQSIKKQIKALQIGQYDDQTKTFKENLIYKYFDMKLQRATSLQIPKTLFNYFIKLNTNITAIINDFNEKNESIQSKRYNKSYKQHITEDRSELFRAKRHKDRGKKRKKKDKKIKKNNKQTVLDFFKNVENINKNKNNSSVKNTNKTSQKYGDISALQSGEEIFWSKPVLRSDQEMFCRNSVLNQPHLIACILYFYFLVCTSLKDEIFDLARISRIFSVSFNWMVYTHMNDPVYYLDYLQSRTRQNYLQLKVLCWDGLINLKELSDYDFFFFECGGSKFKLYWKCSKEIEIKNIMDEIIHLKGMVTLKEMAIQVVKEFDGGIDGIGVHYLMNDGKFLTVWNRMT